MVCLIHSFIHLFVKYSAGENDMINVHRKQHFLQTSTEDKRQVTSTERLRKHKQHHDWEGIARRPIENEDDVPRFDIGTMTDKCKYCKALHWKGELRVGFKLMHI